jgi:hypothetical protein
MATKALKPRAGRPTPDDALAVARAAAPERPPAVVVDDKSVTLNLRLRASTVAAITAAAQQQGHTIKQVVTNALASAGIMVAPEDLEDRTPRRRV